MEPDKSFGGGERFRRDGKYQRFEFNGNPGGGGTVEHDDTVAATFEIRSFGAYRIYLRELSFKSADEHGFE